MSIVALWATCFSQDYKISISMKNESLRTLKHEENFLGVLVKKQKKYHLSEEFQLVILGE